MKRLFLASNIGVTAIDIKSKIGNGQKKLKTAFIKTAVEAVRSKDMSWLENDRKGLVDACFDVFDYTITDKLPEQIEKDLGDCDVIHVNGGNVFYLLFQARKSGFDKFIKKFVERGGVYIGSSAGSIIASPNIGIARKKKHEEFASKLKGFHGLIWLIL